MMQILFGESLRRLRREKNLTQEQLSARLNVSFQTVSKWERGESTPDITMLPVLAGFFGVRTDDLLGIDQAENERHIQALLHRYRTNTVFITTDQMPEYLAPLKEALKDNPNDYRLWALHFSLLTSLSVGDTTESLNARLPEIRNVYEMILENCTVESIRADVRGTMCHFYSGILRYNPGDSAAGQALERIVSELPDLYDTRQYVGPMFLHRTDEEMRRVCQESITKLLAVFCGMVTHLTNHIDDEREDIAVRHAMLDVFHAVYPDGDYGGNWCQVASLLKFIAIQHAKASGEYDEAFEALRRAVELTLAYEAQPQAVTHTSPMLRGFVFEKKPELSGMAGMRQALSGEPKKLFDWPEDFKADLRFGALAAMVG
jgi:transcriptional regulator with XRE-family HTH domain